LKTIILVIIFFSIFLKPSYGQTESILLGTTEYMFAEDGRKDKRNPYVGIFFFLKNNNGWTTIQDTIVQKEMDINVINKGSRVSSLLAKWDTAVIWRWYFSTYVFNKSIPTIGRKTGLFSGMAGENRYKPFILTNSIIYKRNEKPRFRKARISDSLIVYNFLTKTAIDLNLGNLDTVKNIIGKLSRVLQINDQVYLIEADINLNMYCYKEKVPFDTDTDYFLTSTQRHSIAYNKQTPNSFFLVNNGKVSYIDYGLKLLDNIDLDNDGYDELLFRMDKYNYSAYLLITDKWQTYLTNNWSYH
jgi:hypothetical protein